MIVGNSKHVGQFKVQRKKYLHENNMTVYKSKYADTPITDTVRISDSKS